MDYYWVPDTKYSTQNDIASTFLSNEFNLNEVHEYILHSYKKCYQQCMHAELNILVNIVLNIWTGCFETPCQLNPLVCQQYLRDLCCPVSVLAAHRVLRSAARGEFLVPRARLDIMQRRAFSVVGPSAWNELPFELRSLLMAHPSKFYISLKSFFFVRDWAGSASE